MKRMSVPKKTGACAPIIMDKSLLGPAVTLMARPDAPNPALRPSAIYLLLRAPVLPGAVPRSVGKILRGSLIIKARS